MNRKTLADEAATLALGADLAGSLGDDLVFLRGDLGTGKTTLVRGILRKLGFSGPVKSPTYTLLEPYEIGARRIYHFDFYRIEHPGELSYVGIDELMAESALRLVEWPERALERLPEPDVEVKLSMNRQGRSVEIVDHRSR
jgi:tRNA threonylcarbamoyladenosine biosynthesis protein TsaE